MTGELDPDHYYLQPGHPLSPLADKGGRFKVMTSFRDTILMDIKSESQKYCGMDSGYGPREREMRPREMRKCR